MDPFQLSPDVVLCDSALFLPASKTLVISDLQLGMENQLRDAGQNIWYEQAERMIRLVEQVLVQTGATRLVINGDLKHEFGRINEQERRDIFRILSLFKNRVEIILVRGNHDTLTSPLAKELGLSLVDFHAQEGFLMVHGHTLPDPTLLSSSHTVIIGHMHPAIRLSDGVRSERYKCFLVGKYLQKRLIVLPSLSTVVEGSDVLSVAPNTPLLTSHSLESCEVYVLADEVRRFGTLKSLSHMKC